MRRDLSEALRSKDRAVARVLRDALSAIANAEAQPDLDETLTRQRSEGAIAGAVTGLAASEVARRTLDDQDIRNILEAELAEFLAAVDQFEAQGAKDQVERLRADAAILRRYLIS